MRKMFAFSIGGVVVFALLIGVLYRMVQWGHERQKLSDGLYYWDHAHCYKITTQRGSVVRFRTEVARDACPLEPLEVGPVPPGMEWGAWVDCEEHSCKRDQKNNPMKLRRRGGNGWGATREEACRDGENALRNVSEEFQGGCQFRNCRCIRTSYKKGTEPREIFSLVPDGGGAWERNYNP